MADKTEMIHLEGSPWFWKIFGGAIIGFISILLLGYITNINNNIDRSFLELRGDIKETRQCIDLQKEKIVLIEASQGALHEEIKTLREWNKELSKKVAELREKLAQSTNKKE